MSPTFRLSVEHRDWSVNEERKEREAKDTQAGRTSTGHPKALGLLIGLIEGRDPIFFRGRRLQILTRGMICINKGTTRALGRGKYVFPLRGRRRCEGPSTSINSTLLFESNKYTVYWLPYLSDAESHRACCSPSSRSVRGQNRPMRGLSGVLSNPL